MAWIQDGFAKRFFTDNIRNTPSDEFREDLEPLKANILAIDRISVTENRLSVDYSISGNWEQCFFPNVEFFVEYSEDISKTPKSIAVIPFLCNILPIAWVLDAEIILQELDKDFYEHVEEIKQGYIEMYPALKFLGKLTVQKLIDNRQNISDKNKSLAFFSGGADSFSTLINHVDEKPALCTLWGSDITLKDFEGWERVKKHALETAAQFHCKNLFVKSSFRLFINEGLLSGLVQPVVNDGWWHGFQHGIGIISHAAPLVYCNQISKIYFASTYTEKNKTVCASDPTIDNYLRVADCTTIHDGYKFSRQDKIKNICDYSRRTGEKINLRVCWISSGGQNCCHCEKCYRTICAILVEGENPENFGFNYSPDTVEKMYAALKNPSFILSVQVAFWAEILARFREVPQNFKKSEIAKWTKGGDFSMIEKLCSKYLNG